MLLVAGLFEVGWAIGLKYTEGFTRFWPSVGTLVAMVASVGLLGLALRPLNHKRYRCYMYSRIEGNMHLVPLRL